MLQKFKEYVDIEENFTGLRVKRVRPDNAQENVSESFKNYCKSLGILRDDVGPYTPQQNGAAERMNRTIMETVRCMIHNAELPSRFWAKAVATAFYLRNRSPTASVKDSTPYERWHKEKLDVSHLKVFGCDTLYTYTIRNARSLIRSQLVVFLLAILLVVKDTNFITLKLRKC